MVAWSSCQPYLIAILFAVLGFWSYMSAAWGDSGNAQKKSHKALVFFGLSCLSKTLILALPIVLMVLDYFPLVRWRTTPLKTLVMEKIPYALMSVGTLALGLWAHGVDHPFVSLEEMSFTDRLVKVGLAAQHYLRTFFWPIDLTAFYPNPPSWELSEKAFLGLGAVLGILGAVTTYRRRYPGIFSTVVIVSLWLIPHVGIIPNGRVIGADRYTYLAAITLTPLLAYALIYLSQKSRLTFSATVMVISTILVTFMLLSRSQLATWDNSVALWTRALSVAEMENAELHFNVAHSLRAIGRDQEALPHYQRSLALDPNFEKSLLNLGALYVDLNLPDQAIPLYTQLLDKKPNSAATHGNLGLAYIAKKDAVAAGRHLEKAQSMDPTDSDFAFNLAKYYVLTQRPEKAADPILHLLKAKGPDAEKEFLLGKVYFEARKFDAAQEAWARSLLFAPVDSPIHQQAKCLTAKLQQEPPAPPPRPFALDPSYVITFVPPWSDGYLKSCQAGPR